MATRKPATQIDQHSITATLTDEEHDLLEAFAAEQGIVELSAAVPAMIHELVRLHDALWDAQFARSTAPLDVMAREALDEHQAGLTEDFDPDTP
jgi:hypothetical protein